MEPYLLEYLRGVGIVDQVSAAALPCEVCGGDDHDILVDTVEVGNEQFGRLPVVGCANCGFIYQNPRFNQEFYDSYYDKYYRLMLFGDAEPEKDFLLDQVRRGEHLYRSLAARLPKQGKLLDVGCSAGGLMVAFAKRGWEVLGTDPDSTYVEFGRRRLGLRLEAVSAEAMELPDASYDLIVITGSLEHVFDVNRVLALCRKACAPGGMLFIEGRALNYGLMKGYFSHNHRRYLSLHSIELLMLKHGWTPILSTDAPLCGPTRPGAVHVLGRAGDPLDAAALQGEIDGGRREALATLKTRLQPLRGAL